MKTKKDIKVEMIMAKGVDLPVVHVFYVNKASKLAVGVMLLDSCCNDNILFIDDVKVAPLKSVKKIIGLNHQITIAPKAKFEFVMGKKKYKETFCICQKPHTTDNNFPIIGIIGNKFMKKKGLVIDYSSMTLHNSTVTPTTLQPSDCDFYFPMTPGLKYYGLPAVVMCQNGKEIVAIADSGATDNLIAKKTLKENRFKHLFLGEKDTIIGLASNVAVEKAYVRFSLATMTEGETVCEVPSHYYFKVMPQYIFAHPEGTCDKDGDPIPPVEALISSSYMAMEKWVLDFGAEIIYKRKAA